jgi:hypothetical protein
MTPGIRAMPIDVHIDHAQHLVVARGKGVLTVTEVFAYQRDVWSEPGVAGYDELVDMSAVERIVAPVAIGSSMRKMALEAAAQDDPAGAGKLAIVAPDLLSFGLGREYQTYRKLQSGGHKPVGVFRTLAEALAFLGIDDPNDLEPYRSTTPPTR